MMALVVSSSSPIVSSLGFYLMVLTVVPIGLLMAPQPVRRDRRTIVGLGVALVAIVGVPVYAAICNVCAVCQTDMWWLYAECWFAK
jgi:hypothetical protein